MGWWEWNVLHITCNCWQPAVAGIQCRRLSGAYANDAVNAQAYQQVWQKWTPLCTLCRSLEWSSMSAARYWALRVKFLPHFMGVETFAIMTHCISWAWQWLTLAFIVRLAVLWLKTWLAQEQMLFHNETFHNMLIPYQLYLRSDMYISLIANKSCDGSCKLARTSWVHVLSVCFQLTALLMVYASACDHWHLQAEHEAWLSSSCIRMGQASRALASKNFGIQWIKSTFVEYTWAHSWVAHPTVVTVCK